MTSSKMEEFLTKVTSKVKSKDAHDMIKKELTNHVQALRQTYQNSKLTSDEALDKAIQQMGNPYTIGENLNRLHKPKMDWSLIILFIMFAVTSFLPLMVDVPELTKLSGFDFLGKQIIWVTLSVMILIAFLFFDYRKLRNGWVYFYACGFVLFFMTHFFGYTSMGAKRWIPIAGISIDVIAVTLFLFLLSWAGILYKINKYTSWKKQILLFFLFWAPIPIYMSFGSTMFGILYMACVVTMFGFSHVHKKSFIQILIVNSLAGLLFFSLLFTYFRASDFYDRLQAFVHPDADPLGAGYLYNVVKDMLTEAGWFGHGLHHMAKSDKYLPASQTDFAFTTLVYSFGWVFGIVLCLLFIFFIARISMNAFKTKDLYGRLLVVGGASLFAVPICWNILMGFGIVPIVGISLPFISYGGTLLLLYSALLGLILNVYRRKDIVEPTIVNR